MIQNGFIFQHIQGNNVISILYFDHIHVENKIGEENQQNCSLDLEGETFILQSLDGSGGSGSDFSMCTI